MFVKMFFVVCVLATIHQGYPSALQRDISLDRSPQVALRDVAAQIRNTDIRGETMKFVFRKPEETAANLADLLATKGNPEVSDVLDIFNNNFGSRLLVVNGENIQVDPSAYQQFLSDQALTLVKTLFPKDVFRQIGAYSVLQTEIQSVTRDARPLIESKKVPVEKMRAVIVAKDNQIAPRGLVDDIISDVITAVETTVCNDVVNAAYTEVNSTLTSIIEFLDSITVGSDSNVLVALISLVVDLASKVVEGVKEIAESFASSICSDLFGSSARKRRDLSDTALAEVRTRDITTRDIFSGLFDIVWSLLASIINTTLKSFVSSGISYVESWIDSLLEGTVTDWLNDLIDSIF